MLSGILGGGGGGGGGLSSILGGGGGGGGGFDLSSILGNIGGGGGDGGGGGFDLSSITSMMGNKGGGGGSGDKGDSGKKGFLHPEGKFRKGVRDVIGSYFLGPLGPEVNKMTEGMHIIQRGGVPKAQNYSVTDSPNMTSNIDPGQQSPAFMQNAPEWSMPALQSFFGPNEQGQSMHGNLRGMFQPNDQMGFLSKLPNVNYQNNLLNSLKNSPELMKLIGRGFDPTRKSVVSPFGGSRTYDDSARQHNEGIGYDKEGILANVGPRHKDYKKFQTTLLPTSTAQDGLFGGKSEVFKNSICSKRYKRSICSWGR